MMFGIVMELCGRMLRAVTLSFVPKLSLYSGCSENPPLTILLTIL